MIPATLEANPILARWVRIEPDGCVRVAFGKVEYGQGVTTALAQIAAEELDVAFERVRVTQAATDRVPDEGLTVGSMSIETSGASVRAACAEVRALFVAEAARRRGCAAAALDVVDGAFVHAGAPTGESYWTLADAVDLERSATGAAVAKSPQRHRIVGRSVPRLDLPAKVFGGGFIQDLRLPGMLHARVLRQPGPKARLLGLDERAVRRAAGDAELDILIDGAFVALLSHSETAAARAHAAAERSARWENARAFTAADAEPGALKALPGIEIELGAPAAPSNRRQIRATFSRPYISHGSLAPSCALAQFASDRLRVWTHAQGVYPMRLALQRITGLAASAIDVVHAEGAGQYGNNGADDAAYDAAVIAMRRPNSPIRVQWRREDEFGYAPVGTAMHVELAAELDDAGKLVDWTSEVWSGPHPNRGRALAELALPRVADDPAAAAPAAADPNLLMRFSGGRLNSIPAYDIPATRVREHLVPRTPIKASSLRGLGGPPNIFAAECFVDELAEIAGRDPLAYRLAMLSDRRARTVLERVADRCGWARRDALPAGRGLGIAYDRHRDRGAYCAVACELHVDDVVRLDRIWCATDCGLVVNPDGAKNQLEGGIVMAASWALKEQVVLGPGGVESVTWRDYPILRFDEVPPIDDRTRRPSRRGSVGRRRNLPGRDARGDRQRARPGARCADSRDAVHARADRSGAAAGLSPRMSDEFIHVPRIAYFSMEIALESDIPTYAGGLGVLAGDTVRSAADLGLPLVAVTLVSRAGYFTQQIDSAGRQTEHAAPWDPAQRARLLDAKVAVPVEGRVVWVGAWLYVLESHLGGRQPVMLLDTDFAENAPDDRTITHHLYGGDDAYRLKQEIVLGVGGVRLLQALGFRVRRYHLNEGHSALLGVELLRRYAYPPEDLQPGEARYDVPRVRALCRFTTHTPVDAGHDRFDYALVERIFDGPDHGGFDDMATLKHLAGDQNLNMTRLALNLSEYVNGVAERHAEISRRMFPGYQVHAITNGVHPFTWVADSFRGLYNRYVPSWCHEPELLVRVDGSIPDAAVWDAHAAAKRALLEHVRRVCGVALSPELPTLGFARRMTTYKRPDLLFTDLDRLRAIARTQPFQLVIAGKAHPHDDGGKRLVEMLHAHARELAGTIQIVYVPNYDHGARATDGGGMRRVAEHAEPPLEASGTSGMKAAFNGVPNLSVLDGWWIEGCIEGVTGWAIGGQGAADGDALSLYDKLEHVVLPLYRGADGDRSGWVRVMKGAISKNASYFNSHRMMRRYATEAYSS